MIQVVDKSIGIERIPEWFHGCQLNFAENLLKYKDRRTALYCTGDIMTMCDVDINTSKFNIVKKKLVLMDSTMGLWRQTHQKVNHSGRPSGSTTISKSS